MRAMLGSLFVRSRTAAVVGIEIQRGAVALVALRWSQGLPSVLASDYLPMQNISVLESVVKSWVAKHKLNGAACNVVLSGDQYQMLLVEPPDVPESEIRSAIRWRLKELINIPPDKAAIDVFALPEDGTKAKKKMVYVVVSEAEKLRTLIDTVDRCGLRLNAIDVGELAVRNLVVNLVCDNSTERGVAVARLRQGVGSVYIYRHGNLYLARTFSLAYNGGLLDDLPQEALALELQRSVDYYERQMGQAPPTVIYLCGDHVTEHKVGATLKASLAIQIQLLEPVATVLLSEGCDPDNLQQCLGALGGSLRQELKK